MFSRINTLHLLNRILISTAKLHKITVLDIGTVNVGRIEFHGRFLPLWLIKAGLEYPRGPFLVQGRMDAR